MAGPVPTYLATQLAAQNAFNVPFGLLTTVNNAINAATAVGEFNATVDCSIFTAEDVSNLRVYLDSLGYNVEFAKDSNQKSLNIDWGRFLDIPGSTIAVTQGTTPWVVSGTVAATQSGIWTAGRSWALLNTTDSVNVGNFPATQPISGSVTVSGAVTANQGSPNIPANAWPNSNTDGQTAEQAWVSEFHVLRATPMVRLAGTTFFGSTKDPNFWAETNTGSGSVTQGAGQIVLETGATANSTTQYQSVRIARFVSGAENHFRALLKVGDTGTANNVRNWGAFSATDGVFFQLDGGLKVVTRAGSVDTAVAEASWNINNTFVLDTKFHLYEILYSYASINFYIDDILRHRIDHNLTPFSTLPIQAYNLPVTLQNNNSGGGTADVTLTVGIAFVSRVGLLKTETQYFHLTTAATNTLKFSAGRLHRIVINRNTGLLMTIFDSTTGSGTIIAVVANPTENTLWYDIPFNTGLTIVSTGTWDATVIYE